MSERCVPVEEFEALLDAAPDDPRRKHVEGCARCSALFASYRSFLDESVAAPDAEAEERLGAALAAAMESDVRPAPNRARIVRGVFTGGALAAAALLLFLLLPPGGEPDLPPGGALRSGETTAAAPWRLDAPAPGPDGGLRLAWAARPGADA